MARLRIIFHLLFLGIVVIIGIKQIEFKVVVVQVIFGGRLAGDADVGPLMPWFITKARREPIFFYDRCAYLISGSKSLALYTVVFIY